LTCNSSQAETERIPAADLQTNRACWKILMRRERSRKADVVLQLSDNNARHDWQWLGSMSFSDVQRLQLFYY